MLCEYLRHFGIEPFADDFLRVDAAAPAVRLQQMTKVRHSPEFTLKRVLAAPRLLCEVLHTGKVFSMCEPVHARAGRNGVIVGSTSLRRGRAMENILTLIAGGDRDEVTLQTAFAAASVGYIRRAGDAASGLVETRHDTMATGVAPNLEDNRNGRSGSSNDSAQPHSMSALPPTTG
jgi:hypothetical protein